MRVRFPPLPPSPLIDMIEISKINETYIKVKCNDSGTAMDISEHFTFMVEGYQFTPAYRNKSWDGKIRLFNRQTKMLPFGLLQNLLSFCAKHGYDTSIDPLLKPRDTTFDVEAFIKECHDDDTLDTKFIPRDYQARGLHEAVTRERRILLSPTGSGKSLMIYLIALHHIKTTKSDVLIVVPTTSLVSQLKGDFAEYAPKRDMDSLVHKIYSGQEKEDYRQRITITTWQSAIKIKKSEWFEKYGMVIGDEAHGARSKSLQDILNSCVNARFRIGTTGTLDDSKVHKLVLTGSFGEITELEKTKNLISKGILAECSIDCIALKYPEIDKKACRNLKYADEISYIVEHTARMRFIRGLVKSLNGNTLVLFKLVGKHGKPMYEDIKKSLPQRKVFYVSGETKVDVREDIRKIVEKEKDAVIVAGISVFATGVNIKNLHNIVFTAPVKSPIKVLQSIGRGLRIAENGATTRVFDIIDDLSWKQRKNFALKHGVSRRALYAKNELDHRVLSIDL